jgi:hypothetical protein
MNVEKISAWIPVTDELLLDAQVVSGEFLTILRERVDARRAEQEREWRALPWYVRAKRTLYHWKWSIPDRFMGWLHARLFPDHDDW